MKDDSAEGIDVPYFHPSILESDENGFRKNKLRLKAAQVHTFIRISRELIGPLLGTHTNDIGWKAWMAHVRYFNSMMEPSFTRAAIARLDAQIQEHQELYALVPGARFKPKHHFARHVAKGILRAGPPRYFWCFPYEAYYRRVKKWAEHSNRKGELKHIATMLSLRRAIDLAELG